MLEGGYVHSQYAKGVIQEGSFHKCKKTLEGRSRSMRKGKILLILVLVITALFVASCVKQPVIPGVPTNLRATALVGVVGVELRWDAVAGAASYDVTIEEVAASGSRETFGPYNTTNTYYLATRDALGAGDFDWTVSAKNVAGSSNPAAGLEFNLPAVPDPEPVYGLVLELEERPEMASGRDIVPTIYIYGDAPTSGQRSCVKQFNYLAGLLQYVQLPLGEARDDMAVQFMVQEVGGGVALRWPNSETEFLLDEEGELVFYVNNLGENFDNAPLNPLDEGEYYLWARAAWDNSIESTKERFDIASLSSALESEIILMDEEENEYTTKVCPTSTEVTLIYDVSVWGGELFDELHYVFEIDSAVDPLITLSATFVEETEFSTEVTYATECTKYATLTVSGTITSVTWDDDEATEVTLSVPVTGIVVDGISFVLDMANPTALVSLALPTGFSPTVPASLTTATLTFLASDTKCLQPYAEKISFEVFVDKGAGNWEAAFVYGDEETILGEDSEWENEMTIDGTYTATKTTTDNATITLEFDIQDLDLATITATMTVHDCCCEDCTIDDPCVDCGVGGNITHETEVMAAFVVDNVFFSEMLELDEVLAFEGFLGDGDATPTIPASPAYATLTIMLADANWDATKWGSTQWALGSYTVLPVVQATELISEVCSGYATKTQVTLVATMTASGVATEVELTLTGTAVDLAGNPFVISQNFLFDTLAPTLTHFTAFRDQIVNESWIEFAFDQKPETAELALTVTASGTFLYDLDDAEEIEGQENAYRLLTGITLPFNTEITLSATATDLAGNVGFSTKAATVSLSSSR